jgi:hypothetical protein
MEEGTLGSEVQLQSYDSTTSLEYSRESCLGENCLCPKSQFVRCICGLPGL